MLLMSVELVMLMLRLRFNFVVDVAGVAGWTCPDFPCNFGRREVWGRWW